MSPAEAMLREWDLTFLLLPATGDRIDYVFLAPSRTLIDSISVRETGERFEPVDAGPRRIWAIRRSTGSPASSHIVVTGKGDPPGVLRAGWYLPQGDFAVLTDGPEGIARLNDLAFEAHDRDLAQVFEERAGQLDGMHSSDHVLFAQFDAWTDPLLLEWLGTSSARLTPLARRYFADAIPPCVCPRGASVATVLRTGNGILSEVPLARALSFSRLQEYGSAVHLRQAHATWLQSVGWTLADMVRAIAGYLFSIFQLTYPQTQTPNGQLERAFARFAMGDLRTPATIGAAFLNFEPDGAHFYVLAEFSWQAAASNATPSADYWMRLAYLFAALQEVYSDHYHNPWRARRYQLYDRVFYHTGPMTNLGSIDALVEQYYRTCPSPDRLLRRMTCNALEAFRDDCV